MINKMGVFKPEHKDQPVNTQHMGNGMIRDVIDGLVSVIFEISGDTAFEFNAAGFIYHGGTHPELSFGHKDFSQFDYGTPVRNKLKFTGMPVWCWVKPENYAEYPSPRMVVGVYEDGEYAYCEGGSSNNKIHYIGAIKHAYQLTGKELKKEGLINPSSHTSDTNKQGD